MYIKGIIIYLLKVKKYIKGTSGHVIIELKQTSKALVGMLLGYLLNVVLHYSSQLCVVTFISPLSH